MNQRWALLYTEIGQFVDNSKVQNVLPDQTKKTLTNPAEFVYALLSEGIDEQPRF